MEKSRKLPAIKMKKTSHYLLIYLTIFTFLAVSCCNEHDENSGLITGDFIVEGFSNADFYCLSLPDTACIRDSAAYAKIFKVTASYNDCANIRLPEVDFSKYSILINHKSSGGRHFYHRSVTLDARNKTYTYLITTGTCTEFTHNTTESYNMVKVPAIGKDYKVVYK